MVCWFLILVVLCCESARTQTSGDAQYREVNVPGQGKIRGFREPGTDVFTFYGVPYATAPTGEHKFKPPLAPPSWNDTLEARDKRIVCPQNDIIQMFNVTIQEDCLIANILVPDTQEKYLPVLVIIHGGALQLGYGRDMSTINLVNSKKVIAVNFNYRLGIPGFLCLGNKDAPGNAGMKDQVALLRWVNANIASFGGNPNDVTVTGCSAGGTSVDYLMLSKLTDGLMHKDFGYLTRKDSSGVFVVCVERDIGQERFLEDAPLNILRNKTQKILPMFYGFASLEGAWRYNMFDVWSAPMNNNFSDFLPADLRFENETQREEVAERVKDFYFENKAVGNDTLLPYINYFSDVIFVQNILQSARLHVAAGNDQVYLYQYSFNRSDRPAVPGRDLQGANHCAQTYAVIDEIDENLLPEDYKAMKAVMRELWLNFIVYGNPTPPIRNNSLPVWPPMDANWSPHYALSQIVFVDSDAPVQNRTLFWDELYSAHYRIPIAVSSAHVFSTSSKSLIAVSVTITFLTTITK
uniref:Carboxylic ester hydrolase n=1 Tax=Chilo suppressalis TaxID=168631 RepID=A0A0B4RXR9_CHISP|nr:carboxyl/choline esterase [Chilo suppressalis]